MCEKMLNACLMAAAPIPLLLCPLPTCPFASCCAALASILNVLFGVAALYLADAACHDALDLHLELLLLRTNHLTGHGAKLGREAGRWCESSSIS